MNTSGSANYSNVKERKTHNQNIQVYVRVRPLNARERGIRSAEVIDVVSPREVVTRHTFDSKLTKKFTFDRSFGPDSRQMDVYSTVVAPLIEEVLSGYNCTVFAYGQTGTGKTHTMIGTECAELKSSWEDDSDIGIIPRALSHLFDELRLLEMEFSMRISYLELYNEELCDLLSSDDSHKIRIFDDSTKKGSVIIQGLEEIPVHSKDDVYKLLEKGKERRKTASTLMNAQSSRSHTVFSILVHIRENGIDGEEMLKIGKLNLVDLAGSENVSKAGNEKGIRVRETVNINQSLLTLGRVITALVERTPHIPYRESKLTRLLQESLGGRTKTSIIATISPGHKDIEETLSTLEYAHRAKNIQNKPEVNQKLTKKTVLKEYTEEIDKLKRDLMAARDKNGIYLAEETYCEMTDKMDSQHRELNEKMLLLKALKDELQNKERVFNEVSLHLVEKTEELKRKDKHLLQTKGELLQTKKILNSTKRRYKEKKVLLESHVKTEEELTTQATEILAAADLAANDTQQLHQTIERRKDVEHKIKTACERFTERMHDNFEMLDANLDNFRDQHKSFAKMIMDDFASSAIVQTKMLSDANAKIAHINELCHSSLAELNAASEQHAKQLSDQSAGHQASQAQLLQDLQHVALRQKIELIQENMQQVQSYNGQQKLAMDEMRASLVLVLQRNSDEVAAHTEQLQQQLETTAQISRDSIVELGALHKAIESERSLAAQEQSAIDEFVTKMAALKAQRLAGADSMSNTVTHLEASGQRTIAQLKESTDCCQIFGQKRRAANEAVAQQLQERAQAIVLSVDESVAKCSTIQMQLENVGAESSTRIEALAQAETAHHAAVLELSEAHEATVKRLRLQGEEAASSACDAVQSSLRGDCQRLKGNVTVGMEFANSQEAQVRDYVKLYQEQMRNCVSDVNKFKQSEIQTYAPTGATPSKREFAYPRALAATSPHNQIVMRVRQENDWSDLDTTATIDEASEEVDEAEAEKSVQNLSEAGTILNSTPLEVPRKQNRGGNNSSAPNNSNSLHASGYYADHGSQSLHTTPKKAPSSSPAYLMANKENVP